MLVYDIEIGLLILTPNHFDLYLQVGIAFCLKHDFGILFFVGLNCRGELLNAAVPKFTLIIATERGWRLYFVKTLPVLKVVLPCL